VKKREVVRGGRKKGRRALQGKRQEAKGGGGHVMPGVESPDVLTYPQYTKTGETPRLKGQTQVRVEVGTLKT